MSELDQIKAKIAGTEADLAEAKMAKDRDMIFALQNKLTKQQETLNLLLAQSVPPPGKPPSIKY